MAGFALQILFPLVYPPPPPGSGPGTLCAAPCREAPLSPAAAPPVDQLSSHPAAAHSAAPAVVGALAARSLIFYPNAPLPRGDTETLGE